MSKYNIKLGIIAFVNFCFVLFLVFFVFNTPNTKQKEAVEVPETQIIQAIQTQQPESVKPSQTPEPMPTPYIREISIKTYNISRGNIQREILKEETKQEKDSGKWYTDYELKLVARIVNAEAGSDTNSDYHQQLIANIIVNRVKSEKFPNTIKEVIYQKGQYQPTWNGAIRKPLTQRAIDNAKKVLDGYRPLPENVIWQSTVRQGKGLFLKLENHYFCY